MKNVAMIAFFLTLSSMASGVAYGYQEQIERNGDHVSGAWTSRPAALVPIAGNFYAYSVTFANSDLTCDQFVAQSKQLISDWNLYPHLNLYMLSYCSIPAAGAKATIDFIYAIDAWTAAAVPEDQAFLKAHQGVSFQGELLRFSAVTGLDVNTVLSLDILNGNKLTVVHDSAVSHSYSGTDRWYPDYTNRANIVQQSNEVVFLDYVAQDFGSAEKLAFQQALGSANLVTFGDFFTLHLENGNTADFWLGFGSSRSCGTNPCFAGGSILRP